MGCFRCFGSKKNDSNVGTAAQSHHTNKWGLDRPKSRGKNDPKKEPGIPKDGPTSHIAPRTFTFRELAIATQNFGRGNLLGKGGSGRVYKGQLANGQVVAVKRLDRNALQGNKEFLVVALMLSLLHHPNLVNLIGYCADGDKRLLVYEFMPLGSLEDHLHKRPPNKEPLDWNTRMKIAAGAAKGLEYLHNEANPPVIYRDLKSSNILFNEGFHPKLSDFGLAKMGPAGDKTHVSTRVMGTYGYCAPEYAMTGQLTLKSDVYSLGVVFLELITGRKAIDNARDRGEHNLVAWARPLFKDKRKFSKMADPLLQGQYPMRSLYQALAVVAMCLREQAATRPLIGDVVATFTYLASQTYDRNEPSSQSNKVGSSTPRHKEDCRKSVDSWDEPRRGGHGSPSSYKDSPDYRRTETGKEFSNKAPLRKTLINRDLYRERAVAEAKEWGDNWRRKKLNATGSFDGSDESEHADSQKGSPVSARARETPRNRDLRERAVAEAKVWGDNWRRKKLNATGSFDGSDESEHADSQKGSPASARARETPRNRDLRERAVAEAKVWGDNWRRKKLNATDSFDGTNE